MRLRLTAALLMGTVSLLMLAARGGASNAAEAPAASVAQGHALFQERCSSCHGLQAEGLPSRGPSLRGVGAGPVLFYLGTGRMPLERPEEEPVRSTPSFDPTQIADIVAWVATFGGPPAPTADPARGNLAEGLRQFTLNCAGCHSIVARGGLTLGARVPALNDVTPNQVAEAVRTGPYLMPSFGPTQIDRYELDSIARYVQWTRHPDNPGGWALFNIGPIPEGMVAWFLGIGCLLIVARLIGTRTSNEGEQRR
jgi:ubiquinol-cytochrome c reductase cytochrome c subunit